MINNDNRYDLIHNINNFYERDECINQAEDNNINQNNVNTWAENNERNNYEEEPEGNFSKIKEISDEHLLTQKY